MFATLDPKLKAMQLPTRRKILLSDTVGFIRNLPHTLVTCFRATLEEVEQAEVLLHVRDASSAMREEQKAQVEKVLAELDVEGKPVIEVLNKIDLVRGGRAVPLGAPGGGGGIGLKRLGLRVCWQHRCGAGGGSCDRAAVQDSSVAGHSAGCAGGGRSVREERLWETGVSDGDGAGFAAGTLQEISLRTIQFGVQSVAIAGGGMNWLEINA